MYVRETTTNARLLTTGIYYVGVLYLRKYYMSIDVKRTMIMCVKLNVFLLRLCPRFRYFYIFFSAKNKISKKSYTVKHLIHQFQCLYE